MRKIRKRSSTDRIITTGTKSEKPKKEYPIFCFRHLHKDYSVEKCEGEHQRAIILTLCKLSQMTWQQIQTAPKNGSGSEKISRKAIKPAIPTHITKDVNFFLALRYFGKRPMIGYRVENIFHLVYIDRDCSVYKH